MDKIFISELQLDTRIGCSKEERLSKQNISLNITLEVDGSKAAKSKNLVDSVCYLTICNLISEHVEKKEWVLLEELTYEIAELCLEKNNLIKSAEVETKKYVIPSTAFTSFKTKKIA